MVKTLIALRHMSDKEFGVEFIHEKVFTNTDFGLHSPNLIPGG